MRASHRLRAFLWRWHKRVGLACALLVVLVVVTGIALNHTTEFEFSGRGVHQQWLLDWYGIEPASLSSVKVNEAWVSRDDTGSIYYQLQPVGRCNGPLKGAVAVAPFVVVACKSELVLLSNDGVYQEQLGGLYGIPDRISRLGACDAGVCLDVDGVISRLDLGSLQLNLHRGQSAVQWSSPPVAAAEVESLAALNNRATAQRLDWERVLLDLHSGRIAGFAGVVLVDLAALGLLFLALSGFWIWYRSAARVNRKRLNR